MGTTVTTVSWVRFGDSACEMLCFVRCLASSRYMTFKSDIRHVLGSKFEGFLSCDKSCGILNHFFS